MKKILKHAIIGCGRIAINHYNAAKDNNMDVVCCCDIDLEKAKKFSKEHNINRYISNYKEIVNNKNIDSISICTDHFSHTKIAEEFIGKKHIIIEKPLSSDYELAEQFANKLEGINNKVTTVISQHRFDDTVLLAKKIIKNGDLGKITLINARLKCERSEQYYTDSYWRGTIKKEGGSTVINQAYHIIDTLTYLFGVPKEVESYCENYKFNKIIETEDTCVSIMKYNQCLCTFSSTNTATMDWETSIEIIGTDGDITINLDFPERILEVNLKNQKYDKGIQKIMSNYIDNKNKGINYYGLSHNKQFNNFKNAILNKDSVKVTINEALKTQKVLKLIYNNYRKLA